MAASASLGRGGRSARGSWTGRLGGRPPPGPGRDSPQVWGGDKAPHQVGVRAAPGLVMRTGSKGRAPWAGAGALPRPEPLGERGHLWGPCPAGGQDGGRRHRRSWGLQDAAGPGKDPLGWAGGPGVSVVHPRAGQALRGHEGAPRDCGAGLGVESPRSEQREHSGPPGAVWVGRAEPRVRTWGPAVPAHTFPLALGLAQGGLVAAGQRCVRRVVVGRVLAGVQPQAPLGSPGLQRTGRGLTLPQGGPVRQEVIAVHICRARAVTGPGGS